MMKPPRKPQSQRFVRLMLVLSAMSPLFLLWAIRGSSLFPNVWFEAICVVLFLLSNSALVWLVHAARKAGDKRPLVIGVSEDRRHDVLVYLFALMLPFYTIDLDSYRDFAATLVAFGMIVFLFWHLNLHYINLIVAIRGYRVFGVTASTHMEGESGMDNFVVITKQSSLRNGSTINGLQVAGRVFIEED